MDFELSDEDEMLRDASRSFALSRLLPNLARWQTEPFPGELLREIGDLGLLGIRIPVEYGGSNLSYVSLGVAAEELSSGDFNVTYLLQPSTIGTLLLAPAVNDVIGLEIGDKTPEIMKAIIAREVLGASSPHTSSRRLVATGVVRKDLPCSRLH